MGTPQRNRQPALIDELLARPDRFEAVQVVRLWLAKLARDGKSPLPPAVSSFPDREAVRFEVEPSLGYPSGDLESAGVEGTEEDPRLRLAVNAFGLVGAAGVLPQHYTEQILTRAPFKDEALRRFLDYVTERQLALFFRAGLRSSPALDFEVSANTRLGPDGFTRLLSSLVGLGTPGLDERQEIPDDWFRAHVGHFSRRVRSADGLEAALASLAGTSVRVEEWIGRWLDVDPSELSRLGGRDPAARLGQGFVLGTRVHDLSSKIRVHLGPLSLEGARELAPGGRLHEPLRAAVAAYLPIHVEAELEFELAPGQSPGIRLGEPDDTALGRLGLDAWLEGLSGRSGPRKASFRAR